MMENRIIATLKGITTIIENKNAQNITVSNLDSNCLIIENCHLITLSIEHSRISELIIKNTSVYEIRISQNPRLSRIEMKNSTASILYATENEKLKSLEFKDSSAFKIIIPKNAISEFTAPDGVLFLNVSKNPIKKLTLSNSIRSLDISHTNLTHTNIFECVHLGDINVIGCKRRIYRFIPRHILAKFFITHRANMDIYKFMNEYERDLLRGAITFTKWSLFNELTRRGVVDGKKEDIINVTVWIKDHFGIDEMRKFMEREDLEEIYDDQFLDEFLSEYIDEIDFKIISEYTFWKYFITYVTVSVSDAISILFKGNVNDFERKVYTDKILREASPDEIANLPDDMKEIQKSWYNVNNDIVVF